MDYHDPTYTRSLKEQIIEMLNNGQEPKQIAEILGCDKTYPYQVRRNMENYTPRKKAKSKGPHEYEGVEGLKLLLDEYDKACKTIDKVVNYLLTENADLKEQVKQINRLVRDARRPVFSPAVANAMVVHGD
jgi:hypothetical protein